MSDEPIDLDRERLGRIHKAADDIERLGFTASDASGLADPEPAKPDPWKAALDQALADVKAKLDSKSGRKREPLFDLDGVDLLSEEFDVAPWLVDGLITRNAVAMIGGEPKAAIKTWSATEMALAVATGTKAFGEFKAKRGVVAYFYAEDQRVQVSNRERALLAGANRSLARGRFKPRPRGEFLDVLADDDLAWVVASCRRIGQLDLLVLDPLRDIHSGEEDKSDSMRDVMRRLRVLAELLGCAVLVVHHAVKRTKDNANRNAGQNFRGSSAIHGSLDALLAVSDADGDGTNEFKTRVVSQVKGARSAGAFDLELRIVDNDQGEAISATWTFSRADFKKGPAKHQTDDDAVFTFVRELAMRGERLTRTALRTHDSRPIPERRLTAALDRLLDSSRLVLHDGRVTVPGSAGSE